MNRNDIDKLKLGDTINLELTGNDLGTFSFKCVYDDEDVKYLLCQTPIKDDVRFIDSYEWYTDIDNKIYTLKIPTYDDILTIDNKYRSTGYDYWISTDILNACSIQTYIDDAGDVETCLIDKFVAALSPLLIYKKENTEYYIHTDEIDSDHITENDISKLIVNEIIYLNLTGSNNGKYKFKCIYKDNRNVYLLCQDNLGDGFWEFQSPKTWYTDIDNKTYTLKIPTYGDIMYIYINYENRSTGFKYWIGRNNYYIDENGLLSQFLIPFDKCGTAPLFIYKLSDPEDDNKNKKHNVDKEIEMINELDNVCEKFLSLPEQDPIDKEEFSNAIEQCRKILYLRIVKLAEPDLLYPNK